MYMELCGERYRCTGSLTLTGDTLRFCLPNGGEELAALIKGPPEGTVKLYQDDGFLLWEGDAGKYARWYLEGDMLVVTNLPEPKPAPEPSPTAGDKINQLKAELEATDYKIIKCSEYRLAGVEEPYDVAALHIERQALRDEINLLEVSEVGD